jgi:uncharacterized protein
MIDAAVAVEMLGQPRLALIGATDDPKSLSSAIAEGLRAHDVDVVPVNPNRTTVDGVACYPSVVDVPAPVDGAIVMVPSERSADVVRSCITAGVPSLWLFQGLGGGGSVSDEAIELCRSNGITVVDGACPLMFLEPVGWVHRVHRSIRRHRGAIAA